MANWFEGVGNFIRETVIPVAGAIEGLSPAAPPMNVQVPKTVPAAPPAVAEAAGQAKRTQTIMAMKVMGVPVLAVAGIGVALWLYLRK